MAQQSAGLVAPSNTHHGAPTEGVAYHSFRSIEELDHAETASDKDARQAHEQLASLHLRTAAGLCSRDLCRIVADRVD
jgi:hypothetical protein